MSSEQNQGDDTTSINTCGNTISINDLESMVTNPKYEEWTESNANNLIELLQQKVAEEEGNININNNKEKSMIFKLLTEYSHYKNMKQLGDPEE